MGFKEDRGIMKIFKPYWPAVLLISMMYLPAGCNQYAEKKQALEENWGKSTVAAQIPIISDHIDQGRIKQAKELLLKCMKSDPQSAGVYYLTGRIDVIEGRNDRAMQAFRRAVELDDQLAAAWHGLGSLAVLKKDNAAAVESYLKAQQIEPLNAEYVLSLCNVYIETQQADRAQEILKEGIDRQPRNLELMLALAGLEGQLGHNEQAIQLYEQALLLHGKRAQILEPCGYLYMSLQQWTKAAERFEQLIKLYTEGQDEYTLALRSLAKCSLNAGRYAEALKYYDKLTVFCREDADIWLSLAQSALGADDPGRAAASAEKALKLRTGWSAAYAMLGSGQYLQDQYDKAIASFSRVTDDEELAAYAWFMTGRCYQKLGQTIQANSAFERAEKLDPANELVTVFLKRTMQSL